jgi:hypothetical protein
MALLAGIAETYVVDDQVVPQPHCIAKLVGARSWRFGCR